MCLGNGLGRPRDEECLGAGPKFCSSHPCNKGQWHDPASPASKAIGQSARNRWCNALLLVAQRGSERPAEQAVELTVELSARIVEDCEILATFKGREEGMRHVSAPITEHAFHSMFISDTTRWPLLSKREYVAAACPHPSPSRPTGRRRRPHPIACTASRPARQRGAP